MGKKLTLKKIKKFCMERICSNCPFYYPVSIEDKQCAFFLLTPPLWNIDKIEQLIKEQKEKEAK